MHELSFVDGIIRTVEAKRVTLKFAKVSEIELVCGKYNCISEESLQFCFDAAAKGSYMSGARIKVRRIETSHQCLDCDEGFIASGTGEILCPRCGGTAIVVFAPDTVYIKKMEVDI